jgi:hypothetical protein
MWANLSTFDELGAARQALLDRARGKVTTQPQTPPNRGTRAIHDVKHKARTYWFRVFVWIPINLVHPLPFLSNSLKTEQMGLQPVYRYESLIVAVMVLRVIHVYTLFKIKLVIRYLNLDASLLVRNENAVLVLNDPGLSQAILALKIALTRNPALIIAIAWAVLICTITIVIRVSESTHGVETSPCAWQRRGVRVVRGYQSFKCSR